MKYGNVTFRFESNGSHVGMKKSNNKKYFTEKYMNKYTFLMYMVAIVITMFISTESAYAQAGTGYVVQPGRIDINVNPREVFEGELRIHNFDPNNDLTMQLKVIELTQKDTGEWLPFDLDPNSPFDYYPGLDLTKVNSCSSWIELDETSVTISPDNDALIGIKIRTPYTAKSGFYGATIMVSTRATASSCRCRWT